MEGVEEQMGAGGGGQQAETRLSQRSYVAQRRKGELAGVGTMCGGQGLGSVVIKCVCSPVDVPRREDSIANVKSQMYWEAGLAFSARREPRRHLCL